MRCNLKWGRKVKECTFRKMQCNAGHFSRAFAADEMLPRRCPICNQPYDRRYNRPILCYEDGSVPEEHINESCKDNTTAQVESVDEKEEMVQNIPNPQDGIRRGRQISNLNLSDTVVTSRRRNTEIIDSVQPGYEKINHQPNFSEGRRSEKRVVLFTGGFKIEVPEHGGYLGREELGKDCLQANLLVSKKHAYVRVDHFGNLQVKDANSLNGTYIDDGNGRRQLKADETAMLKVGNKLWLANQIFAVEEDAL